VNLGLFPDVTMARTRCVPAFSSSAFEGTNACPFIVGDAYDSSLTQSEPFIVYITIFAGLFETTMVRVLGVPEWAGQSRIEFVRRMVGSAVTRL